MTSKVFKVISAIREKQYTENRVSDDQVASDIQVLKSEMLPLRSKDSKVLLEINGQGATLFRELLRKIDLVSKQAKGRPIYPENVLSEMKALLQKTGTSILQKAETFAELQHHIIKLFGINTLYLLDDEILLILSIFLHQNSFRASIVEKLFWSPLVAPLLRNTTSDGQKVIASLLMKLKTVVHNNKRENVKAVLSVFNAIADAQCDERNYKHSSERTQRIDNAGKPIEAAVREFLSTIDKSLLMEKDGEGNTLLLKLLKDGYSHHVINPLIEMIAEINPQSLLEKNAQGQVAADCIPSKRGETNRDIASCFQRNLPGVVSTVADTIGGFLFQPTGSVSDSDTNEASEKEENSDTEEGSPESIELDDFSTKRKK